MHRVHRTQCVGAELGSFTSFLFVCLNCDLYLFVQVQEDAKESSVRCASSLLSFSASGV